MKKLPRVSLFTFFVTAAVALAADSIPALQGAFVIDPAQTKVEFTLWDVLHTVHGTFALKRGNIHFDPVGGAASGELVVDAASGDSGSEARDKRMHANILESSRYPDIVLRPDHVIGKIAAQGTSQVQLHGMFYIRGAGHEVTLPVTVDAQDGEYRATATFSVPYVKWV